MVIAWAYATGITQLQGMGLDFGLADQAKLALTFFAKSFARHLSIYLFT
jgi:hypothetical protein